MRYKSLNDKVVVITGASSGIGKLAAEEFLKRGARVVLAARSEEAMQQHLQELNVGPERAIAVKTDVSDYQQIKQLARQAREHFNRIDVWVNNAAVSLYGTVQQITPEEISRLIDVNLKGQIYGMKVALAVFDEQRYGNIINVASALGKGSTPLQSVYTATKHGVVGFSSCLREELMAEGKRDINVSVILPSSMDTPLFSNAKSKMGVKPYPIPPIYHPMVTVREIIKCAKHPRPEVVAGGGGRVMVWAYRLTPFLLEKYQGRRGVSTQLTKEPKPMEGHDNLFAPLPGTKGIQGESGTTGKHLAQYSRKHPLRVGLAVVVPVLLGTFLLRRRMA
jgi:NADP-dependent 3-hydroxy acid dehydrogenase YdfG